jgi:hypothetical protein
VVRRVAGRQPASGRGILAAVLTSAREAPVPTVRLMSPDEGNDYQKRHFEGIKKWFNIDFVDQMTLAQSMHPRYQIPHQRFMKQLMPDAALPRATKEMIAVAVSATNACDY